MSGLAGSRRSAVVGRGLAGRAAAGRAAQVNGLIAGFNELARVVGATLGPRPGLVLNQVGRGFEALDDASTIGRRVVSLADPALRTGAALLREMVTTVGERAGDGGATAVVVARDTATAATRIIAGGASAVRVGDGIRAAAEVAVRSLGAQARAVAGEQALTRLVATTAGEDELAAVLGEMFDVLGPEGAVAVEELEFDRIDREYVDGARFRGRPADAGILKTGSAQLVLTGAAVAVVETAITDFRDLVPILEAAQGRLPLLVVAPEIGGEAASALTMNAARGIPVHGVVLTATAAQDDLADLAAICGATVLGNAGGRPPSRAEAADLGRADRAVAQRGQLTVTVEGPPGPAVKERSAQLARQAAAPDIKQDEDRRLWIARGRLAGRVAVLRVGADNEPAAALRKARAMKGVRLLRGAVRDGVVLGGGVALLEAATAVRQAADEIADRDERAGHLAVAAGLEGPFRQLVRNGGQRDPETALAQVRQGPAGSGYDALGDRVTDLTAIGVEDPVAVLCAAVRAATATARLLVTAHHVVPVARNVDPAAQGVRR